MALVTSNDIPMKTHTIGLRKLLLSGAALLVFALAGCTTTDADKTVPGARADLLEFLHDGKTTRADAILQLGQPSSTFEKDNILTFRVGEDMKKGYYLISPREKAQWIWESARYSLVLVFNSEGILQKHNLVLVK